MFYDPEEKALWNRCGKPAFSPFPTMFSPSLKNEIIIWATFNLLAADALNLVQSKNLLFGEELKNLDKTAFENILGKGENADN